MDCTTRDRDKSELFLVEGDSAGGSAESGRDRMYQAVLPLRGKVLNVEKARLEKLLKNKEICQPDRGHRRGHRQRRGHRARCRYGKIVILTDADVDGQHIRTLLLTFFFRQMRKLIEDGHIYVARPPLYKVTQKKDDAVRPDARGDGERADGPRPEGHGAARHRRPERRPAAHASTGERPGEAAARC